MILRTCTGLDLVLGIALGLFLIGRPVLVLALGPNLVVRNCSSPGCLITFETKHSNEDSRRPTRPRGPRPVYVREVKLDENDREPKGLGLGPPNHNHGDISSVNGSLKNAEEEQNNKQKPVIHVQLKPSVTPTTLIPHQIDVENKTNVQVGSSTFNASADQIHDTYLAKSLALKFNTAALLRGFYVFGGLGVMVVMYIVVRTIRLRRKVTTVRRYGVLTNREDVEMTPLGVDDEEDMTLFER